MTVSIKNYIVITDGQNCFHQPVQHKLMTYDNIQKMTTGQGNDYTTGCLLDCNYKMISIDLTKQQALDADPKLIQQTNFTGNLDRAEGATIFFIVEEAKQTILDFSQRIVNFFAKKIAKGNVPNWSEEVFVIKKVKNTTPWTYVISDYNGEEIVGKFYEK